MAMPKSVTRVNKKGIKFISNVDRVEYTITELCRAALRDTAKLLRNRMLNKARQLPGMKRSRRLNKSYQYWVRKRETDLLIGVKHDTWYGANQELGTKGMPKKGIIRDTVYENIDQIRIIQGKYLSAIENESMARGLIDESEAKGDD